MRSGHPTKNISGAQAAPATAEGPSLRAVSRFFHHDSKKFSGRPSDHMYMLQVGPAGESPKSQSQILFLNLGPSNPGP